MTGVQTCALPILLEEAEVIDEHEPWLTLIGLRLVYERNMGVSSG